MIVHVIETVLSLVLLIGVGWWIAGRPWCGKAGTDLFSKFTAKIAIPCYMFYNMLETCGTREELLSLFTSLPVPLFTIFCSLLLALVLGPGSAGWSGGAGGYFSMRSPSLML